jgi:hypothetical protein
VRTTLKDGSPETRSAAGKAGDGERNACGRAAADYGEGVGTTPDRSPLPRFVPAIGLALVGAGILVAGFVGVSTAAAWAGFTAVAVLVATWRVRRTRSRLDWIILAVLLLLVLGFVAFLAWVYLDDIPVGS